MTTDSRIRYLFINLRYRSYWWLQVAVIGLLLIAAPVLFLVRDVSGFWLWQQAWWICLLAAILEAGETWLVLRRAKAS
jgi:hypothetical protein